MIKVSIWFKALIKRIILEAVWSFVSCVTLSGGFFKSRCTSFCAQHKNDIFLDAFLHHGLTISLSPSIFLKKKRLNPTQWVRACLVPHPGVLHTSQGRSIMVCLMQAKTSIMRAEAETTAENTKERGRAHTGHNWLCCRLASLILPWFQFDGCTWGDMGLYVCVYIICMVFTHSPPTLFFFTLKGDFPVASGFGKSN